MTTSPPPRVRRSRFRRVAVVVAIATALLLAWRCVHRTSEVVGFVRDAAGAPVADAYVVAVQWGYDVSGLVHATSEISDGQLLRTDAAGKFVIPAGWSVTSPFVYGLRPCVTAAYSPRLQNGIHEPWFAVSELKLAAADAPYFWFDAIEGLRRVTTRDDGEWLDLSLADRSELHALIEREYARFLAQHGASKHHNGTWSDYTRPLVDWHRTHPPQ